MEVTIQHITSLLSTELNKAAAELKKTNDTKRMALHGFQTDYRNKVVDDKKVMEESKRIEVGLKELFKGRAGTLRAHPNTSYNSHMLPPPPSEMFETRSKNVLSQLTIDVEVETNDVYGHKSSGRILQYHTYVSFPFTGEFKKFCETWRDTLKEAQDAEAKLGRVTRRIQNIYNEAQILHLRMIDPAMHLALMCIIEDYIKEI